VDLWADSSDPTGGNRDEDYVSTLTLPRRLVLTKGNKHKNHLFI
jgi:hypothetical protein